MDKSIVFENWQALQAYLDEFVGETWDAMESGGYTYEDGFSFVMSLLRNKVKEDFGGITERTTNAD